MKKRYLTMGASLIGAVALAAGPALASGNAYTVSSGTFTSGDHDFTASNTTGITFNVKHLANGNIVSMPCDGVTIPDTGGSAQVHDGTGIVDIATFDSSAWAGCHFGNLPLTVTQSGTWAIHGTGAATSGTNDVIDGHVDGVHASVAASPAILCNFTVDGTTDADPGKANGSFDESSQVLSVNETGYTGNLVVHNVHGCSGAISDGDPAEFIGDFDVTADNGPINLQ